MTQGDLFRDLALQQVEAGADENWLRAAQWVVKRLIGEGRVWSSDDVWAQLDTFGVSTSEPRALGAVIRQATKAGLIVNVGYIKTTRPEAHSRPIPQWQAIHKAAVA